MILAANWKAYVEDLPKATDLIRVAKRLSKVRGMKIIVAPSAPYLGLFAQKKNGNVAFAAQDISAMNGGASTGEVTAHIARAAGATYTIVGHSERRAMGETLPTTAQKVEHALAQGLIPILCVGERERDHNGEYLKQLREQLISALGPIEVKERTKVIVAYEPIWAIGKSAAEAITVTDLAELTLYIRKVLAELYPGKAEQKSVVLYGGSVEPENIRNLAAGSGVDGFLVGHASVDPKMFAALVKALT